MIKIIMAFLQSAAMPLQRILILFTTTYIKVKNGDGKYTICNFNNQKIFNETFDYVELYADYAALVNDGKLNLKFYDKNKLNEEAFNLSNRDYVKTTVYDENNTLIETKQSFSMEENNHILTITIQKDNDSDFEIVNVSEGEVSKNLQ